MARFLLFGFLSLFSIVGWTQTETGKKQVKEEEKTLKVGYPAEVPQMLFLPDIQQTMFPLYKPLNTEQKYYPLYISAPNRYAFGFGFQEAQYIPFNENLSFLFSKKDETYSGLGGVYVAQASFVWKAGKKFRFAGGIFLNKQITPMNLSPVLSFGVNSLLQYLITEKVQLNIYGNYLNKNPEDPFTTMNSLFTQSKVGSNITFLKDESHKIGFGMDHQFNVSTKQWQPVYGTHITYKFPNR